MAERTIPGGGKKRPLNMRTTVALRGKIERAAGKSGRSLVQEVEYRIERSFLRDEANGEIERIRGHVLGMLNVTDGKVEKLRRDVVEMLHGIAGKLVTVDGMLRDARYARGDPLRPGFEYLIQSPEDERHG